MDLQLGGFFPFGYSRWGQRRDAPPSGKPAPTVGRLWRGRKHAESFPDFLGILVHPPSLGSK